MLEDPQIWELTDCARPRLMLTVWQRFLLGTMFSHQSSPSYLMRELFRPSAMQARDIPPAEIATMLVRSAGGIVSLFSSFSPGDDPFHPRAVRDVVVGSV